ncbi:MAG TPA: DNRLRE domain-containing protein [Acidimicrobiia bacterium]
MIGVLVLALLPTAAAAAPITLTAKTLAVYRTCTLTAWAAGSTTVADSWVNHNNLTQNNGTATFMDVQTAGATTNRRAYIRFDLTQCSPAIPSSATISSGTLRLYASAIPGVCRTQDIFRVTFAWTEAGLTWNTQPAGWNAANQPASGSRTSFITVGPGCQNTAVGYVNGWDVTADVSAFVAGTATNHGWMIRDDIEASGTARNVRYSSKDLANLAQAPQLTVTYRP